MDERESDREEEGGGSPDGVEDGLGDGLEWLLMQDSSDTTPVPMDTNISLSSPCSVCVDVSGPAFSRELLFRAASQGDAAQLQGLSDFLLLSGQRLSQPPFTDEENGKTVLLKALLNLQDGGNDTVQVLLDVAEKTGDLEALVNSAYKDPFYKGQTALHVAIERRSFALVRLLVQKGADVHAKADGKFFQRKAGAGFYFGELPLSLAACTNQPEVASFLMENVHHRADAAAQDSLGNTVLHALAIVADNSEENTHDVTLMYDQILVQHHRLQGKGGRRLEDVQNHQNLSPLKLAATLGKTGLFKHMLEREFVDEETRRLSRKLTEWVYGPVRSSLYDVSSLDTDEDKSVLELVVFGSDIPNRPALLQIEPLRSLLEEKWDKFASKLLLLNFLVYMVYLAIFTTVAFYRKDGQPPFPIEDVPLDYLRCACQLLSVLGAVWFLYKSIVHFHMNPPKLKALYMDGFSDILFFLQASLLLAAAILYFCGIREYVDLSVLSLALAWMNVLYYSRGSRQMGIYNVMMQRMILGDLLHFLCVYSVMLCGFSAAIIALMDTPPPAGSRANSTAAAAAAAAAAASGAEPPQCEKPSFKDLRFTFLEMFKFTIGMGDLQFTDQVESKEIFYLLLSAYIVLTYILMLNMLIALMGNTVQRISEQSENIWNLQRAVTILDMERTLPSRLRKLLQSRQSRMVSLTMEDQEPRRFLRVEEMNWRQWRSDLHVIREEDPEDHMTEEAPAGKTFKLRTLLKTVQSRRRLQDQEP